MTERKELITWLREEATLLRDSGFPVTPHLMKQAADMLEADGTETNFGTMPAVPQEPVLYKYEPTCQTNTRQRRGNLLGWKSGLKQSSTHHPSHSGQG